MSQVGPKPHTRYELGGYVEPAPASEQAPEKPASTGTALVVWTPPRAPSATQKLLWAVFGRPEPGKDGSLDHVMVDTALVRVPRDPELASLMLELGRRGELSVKNVYDALAGNPAVATKAKAVDRLRHDLRVAAEKLEARPPAAKLADAARARLEVLQRDLDSLDALRARPQALAERAQGGTAALLATFDGHSAELGALLTGAEAMQGADTGALAIIRASLAGLAQRRATLATSLEGQLSELRNAKLERDAAASRAQAVAAVAEHDAIRAEKNRIAAITGLNAQERSRLVSRMNNGARVGARFYQPGTDALLRSQDVLSHLALGSVDVGLVPPSLSLKDLFWELIGYPRHPTTRHSVKDLVQLEDILKRIGAGTL